MFKRSSEAIKASGATELEGHINISLVTADRAAWKQSALSCRAWVDHGRTPRYSKAGYLQASQRMFRWTLPRWGILLSAPRLQPGRRVEKGGPPKWIAARYRCFFAHQWFGVATSIPWDQLHRALLVSWYRTMSKRGFPRDRPGATNRWPSHSRRVDMVGRFT